MDAQPVVGDSAFLQRIGETATECLHKSPYLAVRKVSCEWTHGILFLRGRLSTFHQKQVAQETVAGVAGVGQVRNEILVG
ncbi:MAG: BON domain-containing protein [Pirellulales bacterium]|nr:BON domain-containing protein [Pirellulales bacterium]